MSSNNVKRSFVVNQAWHYIGRPYIWGGDDPIGGFDCSGFIIELLKSVGKLPNSGDWTAQGLYDLFKDKSVSNPCAGCLCFYGDPITHVVLCMTDEEAIGADGGGSNVNTIEDAIRQNAYIKIRPINYRSDLKRFVDLFYVV